MKKMRRTIAKNEIMFKLNIESLTLWRFDSLKQVVEWFFWSSNDKLLEKIFKKLIYLVFIEVLLDGLHVVKFLKFVHFVGFVTILNQRS